MGDPIYLKSVTFTGFTGLPTTYPITDFDISPTTVALDEHLDMQESDMIVDYDEGKVTYGQITINFEGPSPAWTTSGKITASISVGTTSVWSGTVRLIESGGAKGNAKGKLSSSMKFQIVKPASSSTTTTT